MTCPHEGCGHPTFATPITWWPVKNAAHAYIQCASCSNSISFYMTNPPSGQDAEPTLKPSIYLHT